MKQKNRAKNRAKRTQQRPEVPTGNLRRIGKKKKGEKIYTQKKNEYSTRTAVVYANTQAGAKRTQWSHLDTTERDLQTTQGLNRLLVLVLALLLVLERSTTTDVASSVSFVRWERTTSTLCLATVSSTAVW